MTKNQIEYWRNVETERHNRVLEEQGLQDLLVRQEANRISASSVSETKRSNLAREQETNRSNLAREANDLLRTNETIRSNKANEAIGQQNAISNRIQANAAATQATVAQQNANTRERELTETVRHNYSAELAQQNSNPWTSYATTLDKLVPIFYDALKSGGPAARIVDSAEKLINRGKQVVSGMTSTVAAITNKAYQSAKYNKNFSVTIPR